jgi:hypothetical protein
LAAEAHGVLAIAEIPVVGALDAEARFRTSETEYREAIRLGSRPDRLAAYHAGLAHVLGKLGRLSESRLEYDEAIRLAPDAARPGYERARDELDDPDARAAPSTVQSLVLMAAGLAPDVVGGGWRWSGRSQRLNTP